MKKFQTIIHFTIDDDFAVLVPPHRTYINYLINRNIVDCYCVSMESQTVWITINAENKDEAENYLSQSPLFKYWDFKIEELFAFDGQMFRLPALQLN